MTNWAYPPVPVALVQFARLITEREGNFVGDTGNWRVPML